jgi:UDP-N-acetylglucosamine--N-acetylmuramyl-(pentapeptide) pyrophosphoryl-undecaprenol N-acetylglucosamine transferase
MIVVTVGSSHLPFDRLLREIDVGGFDEPLVVQHGPSRVRPAGARCVDFLPTAELATLVTDARAVVTHGGVGSILLALSNGRRPFVVPRLKAHGETVDDHQLESARRFARADLITLVEDPADLAGRISTTTTAFASGGGETLLVRELRDYIAAAVG